MPAKNTDTNFFDKLQSFTEAYLTRRNRIRRIKKEKQRAKNPVLDWVEAFLWAAGMVLLANQYLMQAYQIPSGSMEDTLLIGDHVFVNKIVYGPELLPGVGKLPSLFKPQRNDIIIFENPSYISRGVAFDLAQRVIYMLTISLVDIDRDEAGRPRAHFLIKRAVGMGGDRFVMENGEMRVRFSGEEQWLAERDYAAARRWKHNLSRLMEAEQYPALAAAGQAEAWSDLGLTVPERLRSAAAQAGAVRYPDYIALGQARMETLRGALPQERRYVPLAARYRLGWYVPEGRVLPMGDNRDNSRDGRYFGPVKEAKILGKGSLVYWPGGVSLRKPEAFRRFGFIR